MFVKLSNKPYLQVNLDRIEIIKNKWEQDKQTEITDRIILFDKKPTNVYEAGGCSLGDIAEKIIYDTAEQYEKAIEILEAGQRDKLGLIDITIETVQAELDKIIDKFRVKMFSSFRNGMYFIKRIGFSDDKQLTFNKAIEALQSAVGLALPQNDKIHMDRIQKVIYWIKAKYSELDKESK
jgi:hypothetical protein